MRTFIPFNKIGDREVIVVDGMHPRGLILSHWKGANKHESIAADTSAAIVINAIKADFPRLDIPLVTATHFDIDGFIGVWALFNPGLALKCEHVLKEAAMIGDFREYDLKSPYADYALKLVCWIDTVEREKFYPPFGADDMEQNEITMCEDKFTYFLNAFEDVLLNIEKYKSVWEKDYNEVKKGLRVIDSVYVGGLKALHLGLEVISTNDPLPYYALFAASQKTDIVLSTYSKRRYELEYKYTTWVDIVSRPTLPRIDLQPLANQLNAIERSGYKWYCDKITDTGPILRLENSELTKAQRFANPTQREIFSSSINATKMQQIVVDYFEKAYHNIQPKRFWTWEETRSLNANIRHNMPVIDDSRPEGGLLKAIKGLFGKK